MKDICVDWCESTNCVNCIYKDADAEVRESAYYAFEKSWNNELLRFAVSGGDYEGKDINFKRET